jgi:hypothetical protein
VIVAVVETGADDEHDLGRGWCRGELNPGPADGLAACGEGGLQGEVTRGQRHGPPGQRHPRRADDVDGVDHADCAGEQVDQHPGGVLSGG